jgi:undecaprenyl pyrophosphate phosphatase UppP
VMLVAGIYELLGLLGMPGLSAFIPILFIGFLGAFLMGWLAIRWFMGYIQNHTLYKFAIYCLITAFVCLVFTIL